MSDPLTRAAALIRANPRERAAYEFGRQVEAYNRSDIAPDRLVRAAAAYLLLAETPPDPATILPRLRQLVTLVQRHDAADRALSYAVGMTDVGDHTAARDAAWAEIVRVWGER